MSSEEATESLEKDGSVDSSKSSEQISGSKELHPSSPQMKSYSPGIMADDINSSSENMSSPISATTSTNSSPTSVPTSFSSVSSTCQSSAGSTPQNNSSDESVVAAQAMVNEVQSSPSSAGMSSVAPDAKIPPSSTLSSVASPECQVSPSSLQKSSSCSPPAPLSNDLSPKPQTPYVNGDSQNPCETAAHTPYNPHTPATPDQNTNALENYSASSDSFRQSSADTLPSSTGMKCSSPKGMEEKYQSPLGVREKDNLPEHNSKPSSPHTASEAFDSGDSFNENSSYDKWQHPPGVSFGGAPNPNLMSPNANRTPCNQSGLIEPYPTALRDNYGCPVGDGAFYCRDGYPNPTPPYPTPPYPTPPYGTMTTSASSFSNVNNVYSNPCNTYSGAASYPTPSTPSSGYTNPNTPSSSYPNPTTPSSSYGNPTTPNSANHNPTTPSSAYPNPATPNSTYQNPSTPTSSCCASSVNTSSVMTATSQSTSPSSATGTFTSKSSGPNYGNPATPVSNFGNPSTPSSSFVNSPAPGSGYANPTTPGSNYANPSTPGSNYINPTTPGSSYPNPNTPGSSSHNSNTPSSSYPNPTTPCNNYVSPNTPGSSYPNPSTPVYANPTTPGSGYQNPTTPVSSYQNPTPGSNYQNPTPPGSNYQNPTPGSNYENPTPPGSNYQNPTPPGSNYQNPTPPGSNYQNPTPPGSNYQNPSTSVSNYTHHSASVSTYSNQPKSGSYHNTSSTESEQVSNSNMLNNPVNSSNLPNGECSSANSMSLRYENSQLDPQHKYNYEDSYGLGMENCQERSLPPNNSDGYANCGGGNSKSFEMPFKSHNSLDLNYLNSDKFDDINPYDLSPEKYNQPSGSQALEALASMTNSQHHGLDMSNLMPSFMPNNMPSNMPSNMLANMSANLSNPMGLNMPMGMAPNMGSSNNNSSMGMSGNMASSITDAYLQSERLLNPSTSHMMSGLLNNLPPHMNSMKNTGYDVSHHYLKKSMMDNMPPHMQNMNSSLFGEGMMNHSSMNQNMSSNYDSWMPPMNVGEPSVKNNCLGASGSSSSNYQGSQGSSYLSTGMSSLGYDGSQHQQMKDINNSVSVMSPDINRGSIPTSDSSGGEKTNASMLQSGSLNAKESKSDSSSTESTPRGPPDNIYNHITPDTYYNQTYAYLPEGTSINVEHRRIECPCILCYHHRNNVNKLGSGNVRNHTSCVGRGRAGWFTKPSKYRLSMKVPPGLMAANGGSTSTPASIAESISSTISCVISNAITRPSSNAPLDKKPEMSLVPDNPYAVDGGDACPPLNSITPSLPGNFNQISQTYVHPSVSTSNVAKGPNQTNSNKSNSIQSPSYSHSHHIGETSVLSNKEVNSSFRQADQNHFRHGDDVRNPYSDKDNLYNFNPSIDRSIIGNKETPRSDNLSSPTSSALASSVAAGVISSNSPSSTTSSFTFSSSSTTSACSSSGSSLQCSQSTVTTTNCLTTSTPSESFSINNTTSTCDSKLSSSSTNTCERLLPLLSTANNNSDGNPSHPKDSIKSPLRDDSTRHDMLPPESSLQPSADYSSESKSKAKDETADQLYSFNESCLESPLPSTLRHPKGKKRKFKDEKKVYKSEISSDPQSSSIKLKIKLTVPGASLLNKSPSFSYSAFSQQQHSSSSDIYSPSSSSCSSMGAPSFPSSSPSSSVSALSSSSSHLSSSEYYYHHGKKGKQSLKNFSASPKRKRKQSETVMKRKKSKTTIYEDEASENIDCGPQSPWAVTISEEMLLKIFQFALAGENCIPTLLR